MPTTAKAKTTKAKTKPAKKPATKPAGASVKPKQYKTVKATKTTKPAATTKTTKTTKPAKKQTNNRIIEVIFGIIVIILAVTILVGAANCAFFCKNDNVVMIDNGKGEKVATELVRMPDSSASILLPVDFKKMSDKEITDLKAAEGDEDTNIKVAFANSDKSAIVYLTRSDEKTTNDEIKQSLNDLAKIFKDAGIKNITTKVEEIDGRNVGKLKFSNMTGATYPFQDLALFSDQDKATTIAFACTEAAAEEWSQVGEAIINSIIFDK